MDIPGLHDATLLTIELEWSAGVVRLSVVYWDGEARRAGTIVGLGVSALTCPRTYPWGPSASINHARVRDSDATTTLALQIQSGDEIVIEAASFVFEVGDALG